METLGIISLFLLVAVTALAVLVLLMLRAIAIWRIDYDAFLKWNAQTMGDLSHRIHVQERKYQELLQ